MIGSNQTTTATFQVIVAIAETGHIYFIKDITEYTEPGISLFDDLLGGDPDLSYEGDLSAGLYECTMEWTWTQSYMDLDWDGSYELKNTKPLHVLE